MTDTANLEDGFYWVRFCGTDYWEVALSVGGRFLMAGSLGFKQTDEIDPRPIKREVVTKTSWLENATDLDSLGMGFSGDR